MLEKPTTAADRRGRFVRQRRSANFCKDRPAQTILGAEQKAWFLDRLRDSKATWKIWGNTTATLDMRADLQNLPQGHDEALARERLWRLLRSGITALRYVERGEIYDFVLANGITGFATDCRRPSQFLGGTGGEDSATETFCSGWDRIRDRFDLRSGRGRGAGTRIAERSSSAVALCRARAERSALRSRSEYDGSARRALVS